MPLGLCARERRVVAVRLATRSAIPARDGVPMQPASAVRGRVTPQVEARSSHETARGRSLAMNDVNAQSPSLPTIVNGSMPVPGDIIADKYRVEAVLGRGGMSVVYRATHLSLDQQVAIKVLSAEALLLPEYVVRLKREARAVSRIRSEHVVRVHDIGELPNGVPYLVMECLTGLDLAAVLARRGSFPTELAVECILQACEALAEAHAIGIVHRDLKPANLFLCEAVDGSPCVKVLDFGISRMSRRHGLVSLTDPGTVLGTPSYMAPEQMEAADTVDARSDIWALGTILYELLVGKPPYTGESLPQIFMKIMRSRPPRPSSVAQGHVPSGVDTVVARCLAIEPEHRYQTVAELAWALSKVGTPRARDSAERISRVFDKSTADAMGARTIADGGVAASASEERRCAPATTRRLPRRATPALACAALLGAASVFGLLAWRNAGDGSSMNDVAVAHTTERAQRAKLVDDLPVVIAPASRPREMVALAPHTALAAGAPAPVATREASLRAVTHNALIAVSLPGTAVVHRPQTTKAAALDADAGATEPPAAEPVREEPGAEREQNPE